MRKALNHLKKSDPILRAIIERIGPPRMQYGPPEFHHLAEAIVYQQLHGKAAATIFKRLAALAGEPLTPQGILKLSDEQLRSVGLSKQKSSYLKDLSLKTSSGLLDFSQLPQQSDEEVIKHLTQVKGIGIWTAQMFLMFSLRRENVLPTGDFGIRMAIYKYYLDGKKKKPVKVPILVKAKKKSSAKKAPAPKIKLPTPEQMEKVAKPWEPYRSIACWYLWQSLNIKTV
jgi:DNA-3-methyladenine glycosylase II